MSMNSSGKWSVLIFNKKARIMGQNLCNINIFQGSENNDNQSLVSEFLILALNLPWNYSMVPQKRKKDTKDRATRESWLTSTSSPGVFFSTQPRWPYCVSKQIEWLAVWQARLCGVQIHRVSTPALLHSQVTACTSQLGAALRFTLPSDHNCAISLLAASWKI